MAFMRPSLFFKLLLAVVVVYICWPMFSRKLIVLNDDLIEELVEKNAEVLKENDRKDVGQVEENSTNMRWFRLSFSFPSLIARIFLQFLAKSSEKQ
jgi:hypothetical protein